ncbi:GNAT family N-acetyltransferase [Paramixta manurensis]|uniref:Protein ElaA n=1 Tax=Paramixta manurensis TaxID=2740817 RepID=A0A6M8UDR6_9GAMM|nr:GNAT family N-acetyltransferase [Erwiniaceae bacterium PD-1]
MDLLWQDLHQRDLQIAQLYAILSLRNAVFIVEQNCPYQDLDGQDLAHDNRHIIGQLENKILAYARILTPQDQDSPVIIGRVIIASEARGLNLGYRLMEQCIASCEQFWPGRAMYLSAQAHLEKFYRQLGFHPVTDVYLEDNIPHIGMRHE